MDQILASKGVSLTNIDIKINRLNDRIKITEQEALRVIKSHQEKIKRLEIERNLKLQYWESREDAQRRKDIDTLVKSTPSE